MATVTTMEKAELTVRDMQLTHDVVEVTSMGDEAMSFINTGTNVTLSGTLTGATSGWFGNPTYTIMYTDNGTNSNKVIYQQPEAVWEPATPKSKSHEPLDWLHDRVQEICDLGYLSD